MKTMIPLNFNHLYYFWIVARMGGISAARERLQLTQSTLSLQLQKLERSLGRKLMVRSRRGISLTQEGKLVYEYCERIFIPAEGLPEKVKSATPPGPPTLKLGLVGTVPREVMLRVLAFMRKAGLANRVRVFSGPEEDLQAGLVRRRVDLVVSGADFSGSLGEDYRGRLVARLPVFFAAAPEVARRVREFPQGLARVPLLLRESKSPLRKEIDHFLYVHHLSPSIEAETDDVDFLGDLCLEGRGAAALDAVTLEGPLRRRRLVKLHPKPLALRQDVWFVYRRHHREEPALQKAVDLLMDSFTLS